MALSDYQMEMLAFIDSIDQMCSADWITHATPASALEQVMQFSAVLVGGAGDAVFSSFRCEQLVAVGMHCILGSIPVHRPVAET